MFLSGHKRVAAACHASLVERRTADTIAKYGRGETIFTQGDACDDVFYIETGGVKLSVLSRTGHEAVVAVLGPGDFFGEGCLAGLKKRTASATAITPSVIVTISKKKMARLLHSQHEMSDRFISHVLSRNIRMEEDLLDQFFNSSEERLAGTLLLLAGYARRDKPAQALPAISLDTLADTVGITKSRVNAFLMRFKNLGFIVYDGKIPLKVNRSLVSVLLHS
jgi:CRP/FNR family transcriptional regulator, cyclic AMP receptor protein